MKARGTVGKLYAHHVENAAGLHLLHERADRPNVIAAEHRKPFLPRVRMHAAGLPVGSERLQERPGALLELANWRDVLSQESECDGVSAGEMTPCAVGLHDDGGPLRAGRRIGRLARQRAY